MLLQYNWHTALYKYKVNSWNYLHHKVATTISLVNILCMHAQLLQLCLTLCNPMDCSLAGSSVYGILRARILKWVAMPSSRESFWPRDWTCSSCSSCIASRLFITEPPWKLWHKAHWCASVCAFVSSYPVNTMTNTDPLSSLLTIIITSNSINSQNMLRNYQVSEIILTF